jgi:acetyltransferase-like isoleucine patch superfamily enzyme
MVFQGTLGRLSLDRLESIISPQIGQISREKGQGMKKALKKLSRVVATLILAPEFLSYRIRSRWFGRDRALEGSTQTLSLIPGLVGQVFRRAFLTQVLDFCHPESTVEFGTIFSKAGTRIEENVYIGPHCHIGWVHIERDVLIAAGVHIPSGPMTHGTADPARRIQDQPGSLQQIHIGAGTWIGSGAVIMADVGCDSVIGAGAVVTKPIPNRVLAAGVPARVLRNREPASLPEDIAS